MPVKQPLIIWENKLNELIKTDSTATAKQLTKSCAYFMGYKMTSDLFIIQCDNTGFQPHISYTNHHNSSYVEQKHVSPESTAHSVTD